MSDICERLVRFAGKVCISTDTEVEAAAIIEAMRAENARLKEVVRDNDAAFIRVSKENARLRDKTLEEAAKIAEKVRDDFLSEKYAVPQPIGSLQERFACNEVAAAIRAAVGESDE